MTVKQLPYTDLVEWGTDLRTYYAGMYFAECDGESMLLDIFLKDDDNTWVASWDLTNETGWIAKGVTD